MPFLKRIHTSSLFPLCGNPVLSSRFGTVWIFQGLYLVYCFLLRLILTGIAWPGCSHSVLHLGGIFLFGFLNDVLFSSAACLPLLLWLALIPGCWVTASWHRWTIKILLGGLLAFAFFSATGEILFWEEYGTRYNFIAVDYLIYTTEVVVNIWQSFPIVWIMLGILLCTALSMALLQRHGLLETMLSTSEISLGQRIGVPVIFIFLSILATTSLPHFYARHNSNAYDAELSLNGMMEFLRACHSNSFPYNQFYPMIENSTANNILHEELSQPGVLFPDPENNPVLHIMPSKEQQHRWNVIVIVEESLSASFSGFFGASQKNFTPELDEIAANSLSCTRMLATGTRTVRGLEAISLSIPPTPGQSVIRRPNNEGLFSLGKVFRDHGYKCTFLYGGNGFFDNMNDFFRGNGYDIIDSTCSEATPQTFSTIWGCCDDNLFEWSLQAADKNASRGFPFHQLIMTTSNHRPYTFPPERLDAPQGHRSSAVKYSDLALGDYIRAAQKHDWFSNTLFVIVADHNHSTSGRAELPLDKYHIPALFYNPGLIPPGTIDTISSQIDIAPTIFGLLGWQYESQFFGRDLTLLAQDAPGRAYLGTFQLLARFDGATGLLTSLHPAREAVATRWTTRPPFTQLADKNPTPDVSHTATFFQEAARLFNEDK